MIDNDVVSHLGDVLPAIDNIIYTESGSKVNLSDHAIAVVFEMIVGRRQMWYRNIFQQYFFNRVRWWRGWGGGWIVFFAGGKEQGKNHYPESFIVPHIHFWGKSKPPPG